MRFVPQLYRNVCVTCVSSCHIYIYVLNKKINKRPGGGLLVRLTVFLHQKTFPLSTYLILQPREGLPQDTWIELRQQVEVHSKH